MRFLWITRTFSGIRDYLRGDGPPRGQPAFYKVVEAAHARGHQIHIIFDDHQAVHRQLKPNVFSHGIPVGNAARRSKTFPLALLRAVKKATELSTDVSFDMVYGHAELGAVAAWTIGKRMHLPNVTRIYGSNLWGRYGSSRIRMLREYPSVLAFALPAKKVIITQDGTRAERIARLFGVPGHRMRIWFNGIDEVPDVADPSVPWPVPVGAQSLLWVSRLASWKHPERALALFERLARRRPNLHLVYVGEGRVEHTLRAQSQEWGIDGRTHFIGQVPHESVLALYQRADIFLSLFDYSNLGNTLIEAMAAGCCVIALNQGDTSLIVKDGETGFLADKGEMDGLVRLAERLLDDSRLRNSVGQRARDFVYQSLPTWEQRVEQELDLLESIAGSSSNSA